MRKPRHHHPDETTLRQGRQIYLDFHTSPLIPDAGREFDAWTSLNFHAEPLQAVRLPDGRCLLVYGWRHEPGFGVRARLSDPECHAHDHAEEIILRADGGGPDVGCPWAVALVGRVFVVYYHHVETGPRFIGGQWISWA